MAEHNQFGDFGETLAVQFLENKGYKILATKYHFQSAEIDIIAQKDKIVAVIEVKTRKSNYFGEPEEFINRTKQKLIIKAANAFVIKNNINDEVQFDVISIIYNDSKQQINHIENAFYPIV